MDNQKILIIEDSQDIADLCREILVSEGYSVEVFSNGQAALDRLHKNPESCLILLDLLMPVMNGWEFMKEFLKLPVTIVPIPVYLFSATQELESTLVETRAQGFIKKPVNLEYLLKIVNDHCKA